MKRQVKFEDNSYIDIYYKVKLVGSQKIVKLTPQKEKERRDRKEVELRIKLAVPALRLSILSNTQSRTFELAHLCFSPVNFAMIDKGEYLSY